MPLPACMLPVPLLHTRKHIDNAVTDCDWDATPSCFHLSSTFFSSSSRTSLYCSAKHDDDHVGMHKDIIGHYCSVLPLESFQFRPSNVNQAVPDSNLDLTGSGDP